MGWAKFACWGEAVASIAKLLFPHVNLPSKWISSDKVVNKNSQCSLQFGGITNRSRTSSKEAGRRVVPELINSLISVLMAPDPHARPSAFDVLHNPLYGGLVDALFSAQQQRFGLGGDGSGGGGAVIGGASGAVGGIVASPSVRGGGPSSQQRGARGGTMMDSAPLSPFAGGDSPPALTL